jgi:geranylgeranyl diphosphate synthase type II
MDDDYYRRGKLTNHKVYGEAVALLAGDALLAKAFEIISSNIGNLQPQVIVKVINCIASATGNQGMIGGQILDMESEGRDVTLDDVKAIHSRKTGALLTASVVCGGLIGGGSDDDVHALRTYGNNIGLAFQIADDILDIVGDQEKLGKPVGSDLKQDKATYPRVLGIEKSREIAKQAVNDAIAAVERFTPKAEPLVAIARFIVEREY